MNDCGDLYLALCRYYQAHPVSESATDAQVHHIVPKHVGGSNLAENLVRLKWRDHLLAHVLYAKWQDTDGAWNAVRVLFNSPKGIDADDGILVEARTAEVKSRLSSEWLFDTVRKYQRGGHERRIARNQLHIVLTLLTPKNQHVIDNINRLLNTV